MQVNLNLAALAGLGERIGQQAGGGLGRGAALKRHVLVEPVASALQSLPYGSTLMIRVMTLSALALSRFPAMGR